MYIICLSFSREEYTYQRLNESRDLSNLPYFDAFACSSGSSACSTPKTCEQRWCPSQSHLERSKTPSACEKNPCITSGVPMPKRTPVLKARPPPPPAKKKQPYVAVCARYNYSPLKSTNVCAKLKYPYCNKCVKVSS